MSVEQRIDDKYRTVKKLITLGLDDLQVSNELKYLGEPVTLDFVRAIREKNSKAVTEDTDKPQLLQE